MTNNKFIVSSFLISILFLCSCEKNELTKVVQEETKEEVTRAPLFSSEPSTDGTAIKEKIHQFRNLLTSIKAGEVSSKEGMPVEDVEWNIEAVLNATYAQADASFTKLEKIEHELSVTVTDGTVSYEDIYQAYEETYEALAEGYSAISNGDKHIMMIDIEMNDDVNKNKNYTMTGYVGTPPATPINPPIDCNVFEETDYWYWGYNWGKCNGYEGDNDEEMDASEALAEMLNLRYDRDIMNHMYFTAIVSTDMQMANSHPNPNDVTSGDFDRDYLMFYSASHLSDTNGCIDPDDMNWYYCNIYDMITQMYPSDTNKVFSHVLIEDYTFFAAGKDLHAATIFYGESVECDCPPCPNGTPPDQCDQCC